MSADGKWVGVDSEEVRLRDVPERKRIEAIVIQKDTEMRKCAKETQVGRNVERMVGRNS